MKPKILWHSNAPWAATGYGNQTAVFVPRLIQAGYDVIISAFYGLQGAIQEWKGIKVLPGGYEPYGNDTILGDMTYYKRDILLSLIDVWVMNPQLMQRLRWYPWTPVDHDPIPPAVGQHLRPARRPIAMSKFGIQKMREAGLDPYYIPHGADTSELYPVDMVQARQTLQCPTDRFLVGIVSANKGAPSRKAFNQQIRAFAKFYETHKDAVLYLHTDWTGRIGENIEELINLTGIPHSAVARPSQYKYDRGMLDAEYMRMAYSAMNVAMNASMGEGFGIPIIEAQACGTPVIVTGFSAMSELVKAGWIVGAVDKFYSQESWQAVPSVDDLVTALEQAYQHRDNTALRTQAHDGIVKEYDADFVFQQHWLPVLKDIENTIDTDTERNQARVKRTAQRLQLRGVPILPDCLEHGHDWSDTGVYDQLGNMLIPCKRKGCPAMYLRNQRETTIFPTGFEIELNGQPLDIEDDPDGGVSKIVWREIQSSYHLAEIPFEAGDTVIDMGAQVGLVSLYLAKQHPDIHIIAYEPVPANYDRLVRNLKVNGVQNVTAINKAVTADGRTIELTVNLKSNSGGASAYTTPQNCDTIKVESVKASDILARHDRIKLLKVDTEGAEYEIFGSLNGELSKVDYIRGEFHSNNVLRQFGHDPMILIERLQTEKPGKVAVSVCPIAE